MSVFALHGLSVFPLIGAVQQGGGALSDKGAGREVADKVRALFIYFGWVFERVNTGR